MRKFWSIWFLVTTTLLVSSCGGFRSIRHSRVITPQNVQNHTKTDSDDLELMEIEPNISKDVSETTSLHSKDESNDYTQLANIVSNRIPTLREQMQTLSETQENMQKDLSEVKTDVEEIKILLADLKSTVDKYIPAGTRFPSTGPDESISNQQRVNSAKSNILVSDEKITHSNNNMAERAISETYLQSDEKVVKKSKTIAKPKPQTVKENKKEQIISTQYNYEEDNKEFNIGKDYLAKQDYKNAIASFKSALSTVTSKMKEAEIEYLIGESYYFLGDYDRTIEFMNKVLSAKESSLQDGARLRKAEANLKSGKVSDAKAEYQTLIRDHPSSNYVPQARKMLQQL